MTEQDIAQAFAGKKITLMGLGLLGRGVGDAEFLARAGAALTVTDLRDEATLAPSVKRLAGFPNITFHLGGHRMEDFEHCDMVMRAPNAPLDSPFLARAREKNIPIEMDASLFARLSGATVIGVTGTRGKSTVTQMIYEIAKAAGKDPLLGGNVRDMATLALLPHAGPGALAILELDSWQLQGFAESRISPHIAVWTNFMPDHMNYYHGDMERYFEDKAAIARFQKSADSFITTSDIKKRLEERFGPLASESILDPSLPEDWEISLPGEHNRTNAAFALAAARALGIADDITHRTLKEFKALPNRLQFLREKDGVSFYNDSNSTTPEATIAALRAFAAKRKSIILIAGGSDKQLEFAPLAEELKARPVAHLVLLKGAATDKLKSLLLSNGIPTEEVGAMDEAVKAATAAAAAETSKNPEGVIVLLSPAATSFGIFKNEYDRGDQFNALVGGL